MLMLFEVYSAELIMHTALKYYKYIIKLLIGKKSVAYLNILFCRNLKDVKITTYINNFRRKQPRTFI